MNPPAFSNFLFASLAFVLPLMSACFGGNAKCEGTYGDVWLPAGSDSFYDTGYGFDDGETDCPDGFELLEVVTDRDYYWNTRSYRATLYCVELCDADD